MLTIILKLRIKYKFKKVLLLNIYTTYSVLKIKVRKDYFLSLKLINTV